MIAALWHLDVAAWFALQCSRFRIAVYLLFGLNKDGSSSVGPVVTNVAPISPRYQMWHEPEHVLRLAQCVALEVDGTGGTCGQGPGAIFPLLPIPLLHFVYNTVAYVPALAAFVVLWRQPSLAGRAGGSPVASAA